MRVGAWQAAGVPGALAEDLARLDAAVARAAASGVDLLVTPELFATGYAMDAAAGGPHVAEAVQAAAARHGVGLVWSEPVLEADGGRITAAVCDASGALLGRYRKVHLWGPGERAAFVPGSGAPLVVDLGGLRVGVAICFDVEFPETARAAALAGADVLCVPTAIEDPVVAEVLLRARAMENGMALAYANHAAGGQPPGGPAFCGGSVLIGADGTVVAAAGTGEELLVMDVDAASLAAVRTRNPYVAELRPSLYRAWQDARADQPHPSHDSHDSHDSNQDQEEPA